MDSIFLGAQVGPFTHWFPKNAQGNVTCGGPTVLFSGMEETHRLMNDGDGFVLPSLTEGYACGWVEGVSRRPKNFETRQNTVLKNQ